MFNFLFKKITHLTCSLNLEAVHKITTLKLLGNFLKLSTTNNVQAIQMQTDVSTKQLTAMDIYKANVAEKQT
jgi:hypothetical protein